MTFPIFKSKISILIGYKNSLCQYWECVSVTTTETTLKNHCSNCWLYLSHATNRSGDFRQIRWTTPFISSQTSYSAVVCYVRPMPVRNIIPHGSHVSGYDNAMTAKQPLKGKVVFLLHNSQKGCGRKLLKNKAVTVSWDVHRAKRNCRVHPTEQHVLGLPNVQQSLSRWLISGINIKHLHTLPARNKKCCTGTRYVWEHRMEK